MPNGLAAVYCGSPSPGYDLNLRLLSPATPKVEMHSNTIQVDLIIDW